MGAILLMKDFFPGDDMEKCFAMEEGIAMEDIFQGEGWHLLGWLAILDWHWPNFGTVRTFLPHLWFDVFFGQKIPQLMKMAMKMVTIVTFKIWESPKIWNMKFKYQHMKLPSPYVHSAMVSFDRGNGSQQVASLAHASTKDLAYTISRTFLSVSTRFGLLVTYPNFEELPKGCCISQFIPNKRRWFGWFLVIDKP